MKHAPAALALLLALSSSAGAATGLTDESGNNPTPIKVLLITGVNNHNWKFTSRVHAETLRATGRFDVDITDDAKSTLSKGLDGYSLFVIDYNDRGKSQRWEPTAEANFVKAVSEQGAGVVFIHSANNAFIGWTDYEKMLGLVYQETGAHGKFHGFDVEWVAPEHPILKGLSPLKNHPDELYHGMTNKHNTEYTLLARAMSTKESGGTGKYEPMALTLTFGKGRIFTTTLGHVWEKSPDQKQSILSNGFRALLTRGAEWAATGNVTLPSTWADVRAHNTITAEETAAGWQLLFDGKAPIGFRSFRGTAMPEKGWTVRDGSLVHEKQGGGGDIATKEEYADFEFTIDWKTEKGGNSGVMYRCAEKQDYPWRTGPEMQILDDANHADGKKPQTSAGSLYDLIAPNADVVRPAGEWNTAVAKVVGNHIQHYLNGVLVVDVNTNSEDYKAAYLKSKWPGMPTFGTTTTGHICLQDHGDEVMFRNIKVRRIK